VAVATVLAVAAALPATAAGDDDGYITLSGSDYLTSDTFGHGSGDMDFIFYAAADDWSNGKLQTVVSHWGSNSNNRALRVQFSTKGHLQFVIRDDKGAGHTYSAWEGELGLKNGDGYWFRVRFNSRTANGSAVKFYVSKDPITKSPTSVNWGKAVRKATSSNLTPHTSGTRWIVGGANDGLEDRFRGDLGYVGVWRNGWSANGGDRAMNLNFRSTAQSSSDHKRWNESGNRWDVKGGGWSYTEPGDGVTPPPTSTTTTTTTTTKPPASNGKPTAKTDNYTVTEGAMVTITKSKLLSNDTDPEGDALTVVSVASQSSLGRNVVKNGTKWEYTAGSNAGGSVDTIGYTIEDTAGNRDSGNIKVTIEEDSPNPGGYDVVIRPGDNFESIVNNKPAGTSFFVKAGKYRLQEIKPKSGMTFVAESGAIMSGAKKLTTFGQSGGLWYATGQTQGSGGLSPGSEWGKCDPGYTACVFPQQLFVGNSLLWQVKSKSQVGPGKWFFDYANDRIWFADNPTGKTVETSVATYAFHGNANNVHIEGFVIERYATPGRQGTINMRIGRVGSPASNWTIKDNTIRYNHGYGIKVEDGADIIGNRIHHMGQMGIGGAYAANVLVKNNDLSYNCISGFQCFGFGGGALKLNNMTNLTMRGNHVHDNPSHGLHVDQESVNTVYEDNIIVDNEGNGIHHEISGSAIIRNNVIERNGFRSNGAKNFGILVLSSSDTEVYGNTLKGNANGILGRQDSRANISKLRNLWVHHNDITLDGVARVGLAIEGTSDTSYFTSKNNKFQSNDYTFEYSNSNFKPFKWIGSSISPSSWKSKGMDTNGTFDWN